MADYTTRTLGDLEVALPASAAENEYTEEAVQALLQAAEPRYDASLNALRNGHIPEALREAEAAFHVAPYSVMITEYGLALAIQHGDFGRADRLLAWSQETGMGDSWPDYDAALDNAMRRWNLFVDDSEALRTAYQSSDTSPSYRELLLLAAHADASDADPLTDTEHAYLSTFHVSTPASSGSASSLSASSAAPAPSPEQSGFLTKTSVLSGALGLFLGAGVIFALLSLNVINEGEPADDSSSDDSGIMIASESPTDSSETSDEIARDARTLAQVNLALMRGRPIEAHEQLQDFDPTGTDFQDLFSGMRSATDTALFEYGVAAYDEGDYTTTFDALHRIEEASTGEPQERWYYQGMAAYQLERPEEAREALITLRDYLTDDYPHFDAQAAYVLVQLLPTEEARPYAEHIASQYSDTVYNNSVVRAVLAEA